MTGRVGKQAVSAYVGRVMYVICSICAIYIYCMCYTYVCIYIYVCVCLYVITDLYVMLYVQPMVPQHDEVSLGSN